MNLPMAYPSVFGMPSDSHYLNNLIMETRWFHKGGSTLPIVQTVEVKSDTKKEKPPPHKKFGMAEESLNLQFGCRDGRLDSKQLAIEEDSFFPHTFAKSETLDLNATATRNQIIGFVEFSSLGQKPKLAIMKEKFTKSQQMPWKLVFKGYDALAISQTGDTVKMKFKLLIDVPHGELLIYALNDDESRFLIIKGTPPEQETTEVCRACGATILVIGLGCGICLTPRRIDLEDQEKCPKPGCNRAILPGDNYCPCGQDLRVQPEEEVGA